MEYSISLKNIKKSAANIKNFLTSKDIKINHSLSLELMARALYFNNYNTLEAAATSARVLEHLTDEKMYIFELTINCEKEVLLSMLKGAFEQINAPLHISNFLQQGHDYYIEMDLAHGDTNILTAMFLFCEKIKKSDYEITRFEYCRRVRETQSFMPYFTVRNDAREQEKKTLKIISENIGREPEHSEFMQSHLSRSAPIDSQNSQYIPPVVQDIYYQEGETDAIVFIFETGYSQRVSINKIDKLKNITKTELKSLTLSEDKKYISTGRIKFSIAQILMS